MNESSDGIKSAKVRRRTTTTTVAPREVFTFDSGPHLSYPSLMSISIDLSVPSQVTTGSDVVIACYYYLSGKSLHSLKWYREGHEFYRVLPSSYPVIQVLDEIGIQVDVSQFNNLSLSFFLPFLSFISHFSLPFFSRWNLQVKNNMNFPKDSVTELPSHRWWKFQKPSSFPSVFLQPVSHPSSHFHVFLLVFLFLKIFQMSLEKLNVSTGMGHRWTTLCNVNHNWIFLQKHNSNDTHVTLKNVTSETSGVFTCEITDKEYLTHHEEKFMNVIRK